jgi:hypothetical protein
MIKPDDLNYLWLKLIKVRNVINMVNSHEQGGTNKLAKMRRIRKKFGSNFINFGALDNYL